MATHSWGGAVNNTSLFTSTDGVGLYVYDRPFPLARLAANGNRPIYIASITDGGGSGSKLSEYALPANYSLFFSSGYHANSGGPFRFLVTKNGGSTASFGRNTLDGSTSFWNDDSSAVTGGLPGSMVYYQSPTAPQNVQAVSSGGPVTVTWTVPTDNGGTAVTAYRVEYSSDNWATTTGVDLGNVLTTNLVGLTNGLMYRIRVLARNAVTNQFSTWSVASSEVTVFAGYWVFSGNAAYAVQISDAGTIGNPLSLTSTHVADVSDVAANSLISASVMTHLSAGVSRPPSAQVRVEPFLDWVDSGGSVVSTVTIAPAQFRDQDRLLAFRGMSKPSAAVTARIRVEVPQFFSPGVRNLYDGDVLSFDGAIFVNGVLQSFFDGNTPGATWLGTANNSRSQMANPNPTNVLYSALDDNNRIFSTPEGTTTITSLVTTSYATSIDVLEATDTIPAPNGMYYVTDTNGDHVAASDWVAAGGVVSAIPGERPGVIVVTIIGPSDIPGHEGPFYLASGESSDQLAQFTITGTGVVTNPTELLLSTGADPETVTNEIAREIDIPFIDTKEQAYERGVWSAITAARPYPTLSATVPLHRLEGFGVVPGALVRYYESIYRIRDVQMSVSSATITADWYVTTAEFEELWSGRETLEFENLWNQYDAGDFVVAPLRDNRVE